MLPHGLLLRAALVQPVVVWLYLAQSLLIIASTAVSVVASGYLDLPLHETSTALTGRWLSFPQKPPLLLVRGVG